VSEDFGPRAAQLNAAASQLLGWKPDDFWSATPAELALALRSIGQAEDAAIDADALSELRRRFPDEMD
jgi:uncharacterized phage protein (TIGR02216 family)